LQRLPGIPHLLIRYLQRLALNVLGESKRVVTAVKCDKLTLEEDVAVDLEAGGRGLNTTEAVCKGSTRLAGMIQIKENGTIGKLFYLL
jgi:hypothetical protein